MVAKLSLRSFKILETLPVTKKSQGKSKLGRDEKIGGGSSTDSTLHENTLWFIKAVCQTVKKTPLLKSRMREIRTYGSVGGLP
jgi:hypothetical protein